MPFRLSSHCFMIGLLFLPFALTGCGQAMRDFNRPPEFSPVRADLGYQENHHHLQGEVVLSFKRVHIKFSLSGALRATAHYDVLHCKPTIQFIFVGNAKYNGTPAATALNRS